MSRKFNLLFVLGLVLVLALTACSSEANQADNSAAEDSGEVALQITGNVADPQAWSEDAVRGMTAIEVESTNSKGETDTYTGVLFADLLAIAEPNDGATTVVFVADDGYTAEVALDELLACSECIVSFRNNGGFSTVLPGYAGSLQVKGVVEIQVQ